MRVVLAILLTACGARTELLLDPPPAPESCDALDDDGDARVDEGLPLAPLGERVRVRTDEMSSGECSRCRWVQSGLAPTRSGMLIVGRVFAETGEVPNVYARRLDSTGRPLDPWDLVLEESSSDAFPSVSFERGGTTSAIGIHQYEQAPTIAVMTAEGLPAATARIDLPSDRAPGVWGTPRVTITSDGTLFAAFDCRPADICLALIDERGVTQRARALRDETALLPADAWGVSMPAIAHRGGRIGLAVIAMRTIDPPRPELLFFVLDGDGSIAREQRLPLPLPDFEYLPIDTLRMVADERGFFVTYLRRDCVVDGRRGRWVVRFDGDGALIDGPTHHEPEWCFYGGEHYLTPRANSGFLLSGVRSLDPAAGIDAQESFVAGLDEGGRLEWVTPIDEWLHSVLELDDGRAFAALGPLQPTGGPNPIDVVELVCTP